jgi:23S rRNA (cytidine1920-2'-O)/16S rRNA (cytidine1409-2'-O)-methyltransferase
LLVERALASSRSQAQALILAGRVFSGERRIEKAGELLRPDIELSVRQTQRFVSRGGEKLDGCLKTLAIDVTGAIAVDVGASTGGFTDCLLQRGVAKVYAVDVGHGQLAQKLRDDPRVVVMERTNARELERSSFQDPIALVVVDASFIGLDKLLPAISAFSSANAELIALVKPQFEAGREEARRARGVIRDPLVRQAAIESARRAIVDFGFEILGECDSPLPGPKGNVERFVHARLLQNTITQRS